eukprot:CAMPEP_0179634294 /NCGR_PEP_ID=MMETSP0932-20121108/7962_1 /TAXON_ID=548131 ORGANISM="Ostreococcus mediterraneus, Strain clade-D-RCC2596" /NCGR_SAMPLE_ID=MMETSP0932 /ASSEMBLY_ACC=CAM_ASM_000582 /LENGTH=31 /DNA_ID= /DNA_START= /DNA_END= /DNA_ORIENTATION=
MTSDRGVQVSRIVDASDISSRNVDEPMAKLS